MAFAPWPGCVKSWATSFRILCLRVLLSNEKKRMERNLHFWGCCKVSTCTKQIWWAKDTCVCVREHIFYIHDLFIMYHKYHTWYSIYIVVTICQCSKHGDLNHGGLVSRPKSYPPTSSQLWLSLPWLPIQLYRSQWQVRRFVLEAKQRPENQHLDKVQ